MPYLSGINSENMHSTQNSHLLHELFNHAGESIVVVENNGSIKLLNPATEKLFGYKQDELTGKKIELLIPERLAKKHEVHRNAYIDNPHSRAMGMGIELFAKKKDGSEFPVEISLTPFNNNGERLVIAFIIDITKRKQAEMENIKNLQNLELLTKELKATNEKLESKVIDRTKVLQEALNEIEKSRAELSEALVKEKELNELKSRFLSMASHEFRTPLTTILSSASLIPEYVALEQQDKRVKHAERIKSAVNNLNDILSDFLSLSKIEENKVLADFRKFNIKNLAFDITTDLKGLCKEGQEIIYNHKGEEEVDLDPKLTRNIIINLLSNALKFSDEHKKIFLNTSVTKKSIIIEIQDEGMGISKEDQEHLFERFFRGHNATNIQGTGLGLNIVAKYVELMNGYIEMESELEKGTKFIVTFSKL